MKRDLAVLRLFLVSGALFATVAAPGAQTAHAEKLTFLTEEYPPNNYTDNGKLTGSAVEQVVIIAKSLAIPYTIEIVPWARAISLAESQGWTCVFTTVHSQKRDKRFKWVEPLLVDQMIMVRKVGSSAAPTTLEDAKAYTIGTQRNDVAANFLEERGFPKIDLAPDIQATVTKLLKGRIDLLVTSENTLDILQRQGKPVEKALDLQDQRYGIACNIGIPDTVVGKMQATLDGLIADGTQGRIFARYGLSPDR